MLCCARRAWGLVEGYSKDFLKEGEWFWESNVLYLNDTEGNPDVTGKTITAVVRSGGWSVTSGDFNGDGLSDVVDSNHGAEVYVHYGNDEFSTMPDQILTDPEGDWFLGFYVASAGDVNNDGFDELIVAMNWGVNKVYLYMGTPQGLSDAPDIILIPPDSYPEYGFGHGISRAGDVNGDGFADILIAGGGDSPTYFCLYLGSPSGINISPNLVVTYSDTGGIVNVSTIGDINNDGFDDIAVSNTETPPASSFNVYVYYGASNGIIADNPQVLKISIPIAETYRNGTVAPAGDLNGDGFADLLVGNQWASGIYWGEGKAYIFYGSSAGLSDSPDIIIDNPEPEFNVRFGKSVDGISDFNYDGFDDIIIGCPYGDNSNGYASIYYSSPEGFANTPSLTLAKVRYYGWSVSHVGDIKGNGQNFIIVGEEFGGAYLYILTPEAINVNDMVALAPELDTSFNPDPFANAPAGTFTITATFNNKSSSSHILNPFFKVVELSGGNLLLNADGGLGGVGATLTPDVGDDGILSPGESFTVDFVIGLQTRNRFKFFVDLLGVPSP